MLPCGMPDLTGKTLERLPLTDIYIDSDKSNMKRTSSIKFPVIP